MKAVIDHFLTESQKKDRSKTMFDIFAARIQADYDIEPDEVENQLREFVLHCPEAHQVSDENGNSLLHLATLKTRPDYKMELAVIKALVESGAELHKANNAGMTAMQLALSGGKMHLINYFSKSIRDSLRNEYLYALKNIDFERLMALIEKGADVTLSLKDEILYYNLHVGSDVFLKVVSSNDVETELNLVNLACAAGRDDVVRFAILHGAQDIADKRIQFINSVHRNGTIMSAFGIAMNNSKPACLKALVEYADQSTKDMILGEVVKGDSGNESMVKMLLEVGANAFGRDSKLTSIVESAKTPKIKNMLIKYQKAFRDQAHLDKLIEEDDSETETMQF